MYIYMHIYSLSLYILSEILSDELARWAPEDPKLRIRMPGNSGNMLDSTFERI